MPYVMGRLRSIPAWAGETRPLLVARCWWGEREGGYFGCGGCFDLNARSKSADKGVIGVPVALELASGFATGLLPFNSADEGWITVPATTGCSKGRAFVQPPGTPRRWGLVVAGAAGERARGGLRVDRGWRARRGDLVAEGGPVVAFGGRGYSSSRGGRTTRAP